MYTFYFGDGQEQGFSNALFVQQRKSKMNLICSFRRKLAHTLNLNQQY